MKIRNGFVANSSSTSYCIVGTWISEEMIEEMYDKNKVFIHKGTIKEVFYDTLDNSGIDYVYQDSDVRIGLAINRMKDSETLGEFKARAIKAIQDLGFDITNVDVEYGEVSDS